jgi:CRISPR-associated protein Cas5d
LIFHDSGCHGVKLLANQREHRMSTSTFRIRIRGPLACFTRPEFSTERLSYEVITPSAARGVLEAVLWKPAILWRIHAVHVLSEIKWTEFRRNEVSRRVSTSDATSAANGRISLRDYFADEDRAQRNTVALRDVDYIVEASIAITKRAGAEDSLSKFHAMFERRLRVGQHIYQPYLGCREFPAYVEVADAIPTAVDETRELGWMLHDLEYGVDRRPRFFQARLNRGVMQVPDWEETVTA